MSKKTINDVLEYLYEQKRKDLAAIVIAELRQPIITTTNHPQPLINIPHVHTHPHPDTSPIRPFTAYSGTTHNSHGTMVGI